MSLDVYLIAPACEHCGAPERDVYSGNCTHNLSKMAREAGLYQVLWCPEDLNSSKASELIDTLKIGLDKLRADPARFKQFNPPNGWGNYDIFVEFVRDYYEACVLNPGAEVRAWR